MKINYRLYLLLLVVISLVLAAGCDRQMQPKQEATAVVSLGKHYDNDGLSLDYPAHWKFMFDESPSLYAEREVAFDTPGSSRVSVFIYKNRAVEPPELADHFERQLKLTSKEYIKNYLRANIEVAGFKGVKLIWEDAMLVPVSVEMTILKISDTSSEHWPD